jgi:hypothetical protein
MHTSNIWKLPIKHLVATESLAGGDCGASCTFSYFKSLVAVQVVILDIKYKLFRHLATNDTAREF